MKNAKVQKIALHIFIEQLFHSQNMLITLLLSSIIEVLLF